MKTLTTWAVIFALLFSKGAQAASVQGIGYSFQTNKVVVIAGDIDQDMTNSVALQLKATESMIGPRLVEIRSPGGMVSEGKKIIAMLDQERRRTHEKMVCVVIDGAHSMAFNILTHCDVRLATSSATMVVHKIAIGGDPGIRMTARNLRLLADEIDEYDEYWAASNAKAMHISRKDYDKYADAERRWTSRELLELHYLDYVVIVN